MNAVVYTKYGSPDVLQLKEVKKPTPKNHEVLIKIKATTVTAADGLMRRGEPAWGRLILGLTGPRRRFQIPGIELAGVVEAVGKDVTRFKPGDELFGFTGFGAGAHAQFTCMPETGSLALKPANLGFEEAAAAVDGATTALFFLRDKANVQSGQKVLIIGASGSIGTYAVQLARHFGAEVTGVCSGKNVELVKSLGADKVIDYTKEDFTQSRETYDIIFDTVTKSSFARCKNVLAQNGRYLPTTGLVNAFLVRWTALTGGKRVISGMSIEKNDALAFLKGLIESEKLRIVIDKRYPLAQISEAHRYVDKGHKRGNVVISVTHGALL